MVGLGGLGTRAAANPRGGNVNDANEPTEALSMPRRWIGDRHPRTFIVRPRPRTDAPG